MQDINNKYTNTVSSKLKKISMLLRYVHEKIITNQDIKRLIYYSSQNPLSKKGLKYDNTKVDQPDLTEEDVKDLITLLPFNPNMDITLSNGIFLNVPKAIFGSSNIVYIDVNVISASEYFEISNGLRLYEIANRISNIFDELYVTDESYIEELGNLKFSLEDAESGRLSKDGNMLYTSLRFSINLVPLSRVVK